MIGLARALVLDTELPNGWLLGRTTGPGFPKFSNPPEGAVTAWYTMHITARAEGREAGRAQDHAWRKPLMTSERALVR